MYQTSCPNMIVGKCRQISPILRYLEKKLVEKTKSYAFLRFFINVEMKLSKEPKRTLKCYVKHERVVTKLLNDLYEKVVK